MDGVAGDHAVQHTLQEANELLIAWNDPSNMQTDIARSAAKICSWLKRLCFLNTTRSLTVSDMLIKLAQSHITLSGTTEQKLVPSTKNRVISALDHHEHSIQFWVLDCIAEFVSSVDPRDTLQEDFDDEIPRTLIQYCFSRLSLAHTLPVQNAAGRSLGSLSRLYLEEIIELILAEMRKCSSDTEIREFVIVQRAVSALDFSVQNLSVTIKYLEELASVCAKVDRGVLRSEICLSLKMIMQKLLGGDSRDVLEQDERALAFWNVFARFYRLVAKWAKKAKHAVFCYSYMITCVCLGQISFFLSVNREDVFKLVIHGMRKEDLRLGCMAVARDYIRDVNPSFFRDDTELFNNQIQTLVTNVLPKKKPVLESESAIMTDILVAVGRKHMHYLVNEIAASVLKAKSGYSESSKCALLSAMCVIAYEMPSEMETYNYTLGPLVAAVIEGEMDRALLCAALLCFPAIAHSKWERVKMTGAHVASLALHTNHEIAASASGALHRFALQNPETNLLLSLYSLTEVLTRIYQDDLSTQIRVMSSLKVMLASYDELIILDGRPSIMVPFDAWIAIRHHLESICILWLLHPEAWVRKEAFDLIKILGYAGIRQLDQSPTDLGSISLSELKEKEKLCLLTDYLSCDENSPNQQQSCPELYAFLKHHYDKFEGVIAWTWSIICENISALIDKDRLVDIQSETYPLWKNQFSYLCAGIRIKSNPYNVLTTEAYRSEYQTQKEMLQFLRQSFVNLHLSSSDLLFFSQHLSTLLRLPSNRVWKDTRRAVMTMHSSTYDLLALQLKGSIFSPSPSNAPSTLKRKAKRNQLEDHSDFFFHERIVELYERVFLNVNSETFSNFTIVPFHLPEFLSAWLSPDNQAMISESSTDFLVSILYWMKPFCKLFPSIRRRGSFVICNLQFNSESLETAQSSAPDPLLELRELMFIFISSIAFPKVILKKTDLKKMGQIASAEAMAALLDMGPIFKESLFSAVMKWITQLSIGVTLQSSSLLTSAIAQAFTAILAHHPDQLLDFLVKSCNGKTTNDHHAIAVCNNLAITNPNRIAFIRKGTEQHSVQAQTNARVISMTNPYTILVASFLCQVSSSIQIRKRGLQLCRLLEPELGSVVLTKLSSHENLDVCVEQVCNVCAKVASQHRLYMQEFLDAVSFFANDLPETSLQTLLECCAPWIEQFSALIDDSCNGAAAEKPDEPESSLPKHQFAAKLSCGSCLWSVLESLMNLTSVADASFFVERQVALLWEKLGNQQHGKLPSILSTFLEFQFSHNSGLCRKVFLYLMRSRLGTSLACMQFEKLKCFLDIVPIDQISLLHCKLNQQPVNWDASIMSLLLLTDVIFEKPEFFRDQLPLIVHSACVLNVSSLSNLLSFVLLVFGLSSKADEACNTKSFCYIVLKKQPTFAKRWCKLAFAWAFQCPDKTVSDISLDLYCSLNVWFDLRIGMHLSMQIRDALHEQDLFSLSRCVSILSIIPTRRDWTAQEWTLYIVLGYSLLSHSYQDVFEMGLKLLEKCWEIERVPDTDLIISDLKPLWQFSSIQHVTAKGFTKEATFSSTLHVLLNVSRAIPDQGAVVDVIVTVALLAMMVELETRSPLVQDADITAVVEHLKKIRPTACDSIQNLHRVIIAICSGSAEDIRAARGSSRTSRTTDSSRMNSHRQSIISTVGRCANNGTRRVSRQSIISNKQLHIMQNNEESSSDFPDSAVTVDDLLNIIPDLCYRVLRESRFEDPIFSVELLQDILCCNQASWRKPCLWLLDAILSEISFDISSRYFAKLGNALSFFCHDSDLEIATAAEIVCVGLFEKCPDSYHNGAFKFFHLNGYGHQDETIFHFDQSCTSSSFEECIRFFDGPVSSLIQGLSALYIPTPEENSDFSPCICNNQELQEPTDFQSHFPSSEHRGSLETEQVEAEKTEATYSPSTIGLDAIAEKNQGSNGTTTNSPDNSVDRRRHSLPPLRIMSSTLTSVASDVSFKDRVPGLSNLQKHPILAPVNSATAIVQAHSQAKWFEDEDSASAENEISSYEVDTDIDDSNAKLDVGDNVPDPHLTSLASEVSDEMEDL